MPVAIDVLRPVPFLAELPEGALEAVAGLAVPLHRPPGAALFLQGDPSPGVYLVVAGRIKIARTSAAGREQVLHVAGAGQTINLVPVLDGGPCPADAFTLTEADLVLLPGEALRRAMAQHPALALSVLAELGSYLRRLVSLVDDLALHTVQGRLARLLLAQAAAAEAGEPTGPLSQAEMAARLGTVREMVGRSLKTFEGLGLISVERGSISITDRAGLEEQAEL